MSASNDATDAMMLGAKRLHEKPAPSKPEDGELEVVIRYNYKLKYFKKNVYRMTKKLIKT